MVIPQRRKRPVLRQTRLRFDRRNGATPCFPPHSLQRWEDMDLSEYDEDLIEFKRRAEADGVYVQIPKRGAVWKEPTPLTLDGVSLSETVIRLRHGDA